MGPCKLFEYAAERAAARSEPRPTWAAMRLALLAGAGGVALSAALAQPVNPAAAPATAATQPPTMVLWTADDCAYCTVWRRGERAQEFAAQADRLGVQVGVMNKRSLKDPATSYRWLSAGVGPPAELLQNPPHAVPTFEFFCKGRSQRRFAGLDNWDSFWRSEVRRLARECAVTPAAATGS